jgi:hypothetical protein
MNLENLWPGLVRDAISAQMTFGPLGLTLSRQEGHEIILSHSLAGGHTDCKAMLVRQHHRTVWQVPAAPVPPSGRGLAP